MSEKRRHARVSGTGVAGHVRSHDRSVACSIDNLSVGGAFVRTAVPVQLGLAIMVDLVKPGLKKAVRVSGRVVAVVSAAEAAATGRHAGMAVEFDPPDDETDARLQALLHALGLPDQPKSDGSVVLHGRIAGLLNEVA